MAKNKTTETTGSVTEFIDKVTDTTKRNDCYTIIELMQQLSGLQAKMWGPAIVGFGSCHYKYESGREGDMPMIAFSPRTTAIVLYLSANFDNRETLLTQLGKHKTGKGCIYIKKLTDVDMEILKQMIANALKHARKTY